MEILGWLCTLLILIGYLLNSSQQTKYAMIVWCVGDIGWIVYDMSIHNISHAVLSGIIILLNTYGLYKLSKK
jgi:hypothetical protein